MKTPQDFKEAAVKMGVDRWNIHDCSICGYPCGYVIRGDEVSYDTGCNCSWGGERPSSWEELADSYNRNAGAEDAQERAQKYPLFVNVIRRQNATWGFDNPEWLDAPEHDKD